MEMRLRNASNQDAQEATSFTPATAPVTQISFGFGQRQPLSGRIRLVGIIITTEFPHAETARALFTRLVHREPLPVESLATSHHVD
jgi:hypothetical protein